MNISFEKSMPDDYVRIYDGEVVILAVSSVSKYFPGLWKNDHIKILGIDEI